MADTALTTIVSSTPIDLAIAGWLGAHKKSEKTLHAYQDVISEFRYDLQRVGTDLDSDVRTLALVAQRFAAETRNPDKERASSATFNQRLAILSSFYKYAMGRYLLQPMDDAGHVANPIDLVQREKVQAYQGVHWLEPEQAIDCLRKIDRASLAGLRDYALLTVLLYTGRRLAEVTALQWRHVQLLRNGKILLTFEHCKRDKTMRDTLTPAHSKALLAWLHAYYGAELGDLAGNAPVWVCISRNTKQHGKALGIQGVQQVCEKYLETHTHVTRHTFTQLMMKAGATLPEIQDRLGHESLATTGIYARVFTSAENPHAERIAAMLGIE